MWRRKWVSRSSPQSFPPAYDGQSADVPTVACRISGHADLPSIIYNIGRDMRLRLQAAHARQRHRAREAAKARRHNHPGALKYYTEKT
jgi:hypothetical protein